MNNDIFKKILSLSKLFNSNLNRMQFQFTSKLQLNFLIIFPKLNKLLE